MSAATPSVASRGEAPGARREPRTATDVANRYREAGGFRPFLLVLLALAHGDGHTWETPSKAAVRRALTRPADEESCTETDAETALVHAIAMGLVAEGSTLRRIILTGGEVE